MITMIFEKTLARKIVAAPKNSQDAKSPVTDEIGPLVDAKRHSKLRQKSLWKRIQWATSWLFWSRPTSKTVREPASMGKILNLMRCVSPSINPGIIYMLNLLQE